MLAIASLYLAGCTALPTTRDATGASQASPDLYQRHLADIAPIHDFTLEGRIAVQTDGKGVSGSLHWQHVNAQDTIAMFSPMGGKIAEVHTSTDNVTLTSNDGKTYSAVDAETLTEQTLGWRMPVRNLSDWIVGRPARSTANTLDTASWDNQGKLTKLYEDGWEVNYLEYRMVAGQQLPSKLTLRNTKLYIKLLLERWDIITDRPSKLASPSTPPILKQDD